MVTRAARIAARATVKAARIQPRRPTSARQPSQINRASQTSRAETARSLETQAGVAWLINWCAQVELDLRRQRLTTALSPVGASYGA